MFSVIALCIGHHVLFICSMSHMYTDNLRSAILRSDFFACIPFVKARGKVKQTAKQMSPEAILHVTPPPQCLKVCLTAHCFICLRKITTVCKYFLNHIEALETSWGLCSFSFDLCLSCFHQVGIRVFSTAFLAIGQRQTFRNTFHSSTTSAASPSTPISQHSSSEWDLTC